MRNLLGIRHLSQREIEELLLLAGDFKQRIRNDKPVDAVKKVVGMLFFEDSTRTRVSFEQAAYYLGMKSTNFAGAGSSMSKGETLKDTILTLRYERLDALVMRHRSSGSPGLAAEFFGGPVVNAGDGRHEHPTQALADALTIIEKKGGLAGLTVALVGDIEHSRVARSNAWLLTKLGANVRFVGPKTLLPDHSGLLPGQLYHDLEEGIKDCDVVIALRLQKERMLNGLGSSVNEYAKMYGITREKLRWAASDCLLLHPGPINRGVELDDSAADGDQSVITAQVENGIYVRMAALKWCFEEEPEPKPKKAAAKPKKGEKK
jgi:aspartate carbamoyltransferase catalytic subunit